MVEVGSYPLPLWENRSGRKGSKSNMGEGVMHEKICGNTRSVILSNVHIGKTYPLNENSDLHSIV